MIQNIIRWFFDLLCCYYLYFKLLNFNFRKRNMLFFFLLYSLVKLSYLILSMHVCLYLQSLSLSF